MATVVDMAAVYRLMANCFLAIATTSCDKYLPNEEPKARDDATADTSGEAPLDAVMLDPAFTGGAPVGGDSSGSSGFGVTFNAVLVSPAETALGQSPYRLYSVATQIVAGMTSADLVGDSHYVRWSGIVHCEPQADPDDPRMRSLLIAIEGIAGRVSGETVVSIG